MAVFNLTEYTKEAIATQMIQAPTEPSITSESTNYTAPSLSNIFNSRTNLIRVIVTSIAYMKCGVSPVATINSTKLMPNTDYWFVIKADTNLRMSFYDGE